MNIGQFSETTGVSADTLRYYERAGLMPPVRRGNNGHRDYDSSHVFWVGFLRRLRNAGMPISKLRSYARLVDQGDQTLDRRVRLIEEHRSQIVEQIATLEDNLELLDIKLSYYAEKGKAGSPLDFVEYLAGHGRAADGSIRLAEKEPR